MDFEELIAKRRVVVLLGPGGVGKTSCSIGIAVAAARLGRRVGLLSIDPAKRLAAALGIPLGHQLQEISLGPGGPLPAGSLKAAMLDQKAVFDAMVRRHAPDQTTADKILGNSLYQAASTKLAGPMEYMALAKLQEMVDDPAYDFIVLDTPPDSHALDFLARPNILAGFMENRVMSWLIKPFHMASRFGVVKIFSVGERLMGGLAKVTGFQALRLLTEFLVLMQQVIDGFHSSSEQILATLKSPQTAFVLVTVAQQAALRSASNLGLQLTRLGYPFDVVLFNKYLPAEVSAGLRRIQPTVSASASSSTVGAQAAPGWVDTALTQLIARRQLEAQLPREFLASVRAKLGHQPLALAIPEQDDLQTGEAIYQFSHAFTAPALLPDL